MPSLWCHLVFLLLLFSYGRLKGKTHFMPRLIFQILSHIQKVCHNWHRPDIVAYCHDYCKMYVCFRAHNVQVTWLSLRCLLWFTIAATLWISDRLMCPYWLRVRLPYGHALWHILMAYVACYSCVVFCYLDTVSQYPDTTPMLCYWPSSKNTWLGLPYVSFLTPYSIQKEKAPCIVA